MPEARRTEHDCELFWLHGQGEFCPHCDVLTLQAEPIRRAATGERRELARPVHLAAGPVAVPDGGGRTGQGPGPRRRPERSDGIGISATAVCVGLVLWSVTSLSGSGLAPLPAGAGNGGGPTASAPASSSALPTSGVVAAPPAAVLQSGPAAVTVGVEPAAATTALPDQRARIAVEVAMKQIGLPYVWGGNGPENGHRGFDCSGLTTFAYDKAGVDLPRTAHTQFRHGPRVPENTPLQPGDLVFYGTYKKVHHVGMYIGSGRMVNAPTFGKPVQTAWYRYNGDDYIGATRPAATGSGALPAVPDPAVPELPDPTIPDVTEFPAPPAPPLPAVPDPRAPQPPQSLTAADSLRSAGPVTPRPTTSTPAIAMPQPRSEGAPTSGPHSEGAPDPTSPPPRPTPVSPTPTPTPTPPPTPTTTPSPPSSTSPSPTAPVTPSPAPPASRAVTEAKGLLVAGSLLPTPAVPVDATGLPAEPGSWAGSRRWIVRLALEAIPAQEAGARLTLRLSDGSTRVFTVTASRTLSTDQAAAAGGPLVVVMPTGTADRWQVTTAR
ncbi:secreted transglycosylase [Pseudonocardia sp. Ae717_Ps2]|nr:secreted transglycosylase [Pseudonocardia sp. Ae717_Ps2]